MKYSEKDLRKILRQDIRISQEAENRIQKTYKTLPRPISRRSKNRMPQAAALALLCIALPVGAYASVKTDFFQAMFGNDTKQSNPAIQKEIDDGKGNKIAVTIPSKEYVPVDEEKADEILGAWLSDAPIEKKIGSHTLSIQNFVYDQNGALMYFTLEREGGVTVLRGDQETNLGKGASFTDESDFYFICETEQGVIGFDNTYVDTVKSSPEKMYCSAYILWERPLKDGDIPCLTLDTYPCPRKDLTENTEISTEKIRLTEKEPLPINTVDLGDQGYLEYSPISLTVDLAKGLGLSAEQAQDPYYLEHLEILYEDNSSYVICDKDSHIDNSGYTLGRETYYATLYNRLTDAAKIEKIIVNGVEFPVK